MMKQRLTVFNRLTILDKDRLDRTRGLGVDLVEQLHCFDDAQRIAEPLPHCQPARTVRHRDWMPGRKYRPWAP
jgi:hypothetical protein